MVITKTMLNRLEALERERKTKQLAKAGLSHCCYVIYKILETGEEIGRQKSTCNDIFNLQAEFAQEWMKEMIMFTEALENGNGKV